MQHYKIMTILSVFFEVISPKHTRACSSLKRWPRSLQTAWHAVCKLHGHRAVCRLREVSRLHGTYTPGYSMSHCTYLNFLIYICDNSWLFDVSYRFRPGLSTGFYGIISWLSATRIHKHKVVKKALLKEWYRCAILCNDIDVQFFARFGTLCVCIQESLSWMVLCAHNLQLYIIKALYGW